MVSGCVSYSLGANSFAGERLPYHQIEQTRRAQNDHGKCRTNSSQHEMLRKSGVAKSRNSRKNSHASEDANKRYLSILSSWRRERDLNHESASPYPFENSKEFSKLGTRGPRRSSRTRMCRCSCGTVAPPPRAPVPGTNQGDPLGLGLAPQRACFAGGVFVLVDGVLPFTVLDRLGRNGAVGISVLAVSAISSPNRAATSLSTSSSTFAALVPLSMVKDLVRNLRSIRFHSRRSGSLSPA